MSEAKVSRAKGIAIRHAWREPTRVVRVEGAASRPNFPTRSSTTRSKFLCIGGGGLTLSVCGLKKQSACVKSWNSLWMA